MMLPGFLLKTMEEGAKPRQPEEAGVPKCFTKIAYEARFCPNCGNQILKVNKCLKCGEDLPPKPNSACPAGPR